MGRLRTEKLVVVVDDDPLVLEAMGSLLRIWGCRVVTAESCSEAMKALTEVGRRPDLIVCDYRLPQGPTGVDTIEILRNAFEIPAVLISADPTGDYSEGYRFLRKPVSAAAFREALVNAAVL